MEQTMSDVIVAMLIGTGVGLSIGLAFNLYIYR
jgi:hypothetical protein